jgi:hypothetical protein
MNTYVMKNGEQLGPYDDGQLAELVKSGRVSHDDFAWAEGMATWQPLRAILKPASSVFPPAPPPPPPAPVPGGGGDATGGIIPYKNPQAWISYYLGVFSLIPVLGFLLTIPAIVLGVLGLKKKKKFPMIKGSAHAWIGISLASFSMLYHLVPLAIIVFASKH